LWLEDGLLNGLERISDDALLIRAPLDEERLFEWNWATALVSRAMKALSDEYAGERKARVFAELRPFLTGGVGLPTHEAAARPRVGGKRCAPSLHWRAVSSAASRRSITSLWEKDIDGGCVTGRC
jgi:hypothetical protein